MESYKHKHAKRILKEWLSKDYLRIDLEYKYCLNGNFYFIPDLVCFDKDGVKAIYEIVHRHELDGKKLARMQFYFYISDTNIKIYEISADWILNQIEQPKELILTDFSLPEFEP